MAEFAHPMSLGSLARLMDLPEGDEGRWFDWVERMYSNAILDSAITPKPLARPRRISTS